MNTEKINIPQRSQRLSKLRNSVSSTSEIIFDPETRQRYKKGNKLGGGGFVEVYEFIDIDTNEIYAAKIIPIKRIEKDPQSNAAFNNENKFNNNLNFEYLCKCQSIFKDNQNAYFILDYYPNKTLNELIKVRYTLSEIEVKHYGYQLLLAIQYLHSCNIIHRDLKLSNILLSDKMEVRLCDFGLAIENGGDGQQTICGTPNYIAPEVFIRKNNNSYSFEIDIWSFGVILYTLLFHKTPFENDVKGKTKYNIINVIYNFPNNIHISDDAKDIIMKIFVKEPYLRPKIEEIKAHPFFNYGKGIPKYLPTSTLTHPLSENEMNKLIENALINNECLDKEYLNLNNNNFIYSYNRRLNFNDNLRNNNKSNKYIPEVEIEEEKENEELQKSDNEINNNNSNSNNNNNNSKSNSNSSNEKNSEKEEKLNKLINDIKTTKVSEEKLNKNNETGGFLDNSNSDEKKQNNDQIIIEKFIDRSDKYGIGYLLTNGDIGVYFNDGTKMILIKPNHKFFYIKKNNEQKYIHFKEHIKNSELESKRTIFKLFYKNLTKDTQNKKNYDNNTLTDKRNISCYVVKYEKTKYASFFLLSSQIIQVIYNDKTEIHFILQDKTIQYIDKNKMKYIEKYDNINPIQYNNEEINKRVIYARNILSKK